MIALMSGSLRQNSHNTRFLEEVADTLEDDYIFLDIDGLPSYNEDRDGDTVPERVQILRDLVSQSDGVIISTPEYNGSIPGHLKNALDWLSRPFPQNALHKKPVAIFGVSTGMFGAVWAQADLRKVLGIIGAKPVLEEDQPIGHADQYDRFLDDDNIRDMVQERLYVLKESLVNG